MPVISPILRLPNEIILKTIHLAITNTLSPVEDLSTISSVYTPYRKIEAVRSARRAATDMSQVCGRWRNITQKDPTIWRHIVIPIMDNNDLRNLEWFSNMVERHATLSQGLEVTVKIAFCCIQPLLEHDSIPPAWYTLMMRIVSISSRWHSFETTTGGNDSLGQDIWSRLSVIELMPMFHPAAKHLVLDSALLERWLSSTRVTPLDRCETIIADVTMGVSSLFPQLTKTFDSVKSIDLRLHAVGLRRGGDGEWVLARSILLLRCFPNLRSFTIRIPVKQAIWPTDDIWRVPREQAVIPLPQLKLRHLQQVYWRGFESYTQLSMQAYLSKIEARNLKLFYSKEPTIRTLPEFLQRSQCSLTSLYICLDIDKPELALDDSLLQHSPHLTTLGLSAIPGTSTDAVVQKLKDPAVLPGLKDLTLELLDRARDVNPGSPPSAGFTTGPHLLQILQARGQQLKRLYASVTTIHQHAQVVRDRVESYRGSMECKVVMFCDGGYRTTVDVDWEGQDVSDNWEFPENVEYEIDEDTL